MVYDPNELFSETPGTVSNLRVIPQVVQPKTFASGTALLPELTPLAFNTSLNQWVPWDADGPNETDSIRGFVWPDEVQLVDGKEVLGQVLMLGRLHVDDVDLSQTPGPETIADLKTELRNNVRDRGLIIEGLDQFH